MANNSKAVLEETQKLNKEIASLQRQLHEARETIKLIKTGNIDALIASDKKDLKVYTEKTADKVYRILIEEMHEGAVTINKDGLILYCNSYFAKIVGQPLQNVLGKKFKNFLHDSSIKRFDEVFAHGWNAYSQAELRICAKNDHCVPVLMSVNNLKLDYYSVLSIIITDLTIPNRNQEELKRRTEELEQKNIELEIANTELASRNQEKEKRTEELQVANMKLAMVNVKNELRAAELALANKELAFQNEEKEKRAAELRKAYKELKLAEECQEEYIQGLKEMMYMTSHKLRVPITNILGISEVLDQTIQTSEKLKKIVDYIKRSALIMDDFTKELSVTMESLEQKIKNKLNNI
ncbi:MAG: PAS domain-containing protein [Bacteroidia bacterium]